MTWCCRATFLPTWPSSRQLYLVLVFFSFVRTAHFMPRLFDKLVNVLSCGNFFVTFLFHLNGSIISGRMWRRLSFGLSSLQDQSFRVVFCIWFFLAHFSLFPVLFLEYRCCVCVRRLLPFTSVVAGGGSHGGFGGNVILQKKISIIISNSIFFFPFRLYFYLLDTCLTKLIFAVP